MDAIVRLPHPWSGDSQGQEMFLAPSANKQTRNHGTRVLKTPSLPINPKVIYIYNYIYNYIYDIIIYIIYLFIYLYIYKSHFEVFLRL